MHSLLLQMLEIPGKSGAEGAIAHWIVDRLKESGVPDSAIRFDQAHRRSPIGGETGNLIVKIPGKERTPRRLLMGHIDTVPLCVGARPVVQGNKIRSADPQTALGGDNRAGAAVVLQTWLDIARSGKPHPPLTLFWPVQEEIGLVGARYVNVKALGQPHYCYNWDGGAPEQITIGATGAEHLEIEVTGIASHAGVHPERGVNALTIAARAIADLDEAGWQGLVIKGKDAGTSNLGIVTGGAATNVVLDRLLIQGEVRSHKAAFRRKIIAAIRQAFETARQSVRNIDGKTGQFDLRATLKYEAFRLPARSPVVVSAQQAVTAAGLSPELKVSNGGLDANWLTAHGLPTVTLGCGQFGIHTVQEELNLDQFQQALEIARTLALSSPEI
jgi:tripeptide aminopeptidase